MSLTGCFPFSTRSVRRSLAAAFWLSWALPCVASASDHYRVVQTDTVPEPRTVWVKSAVLPGWGQAVNRQSWKIPVIYGALGGIGWFVANQHSLYKDYRAAYYNSQPGKTDLRFGPTKPNLQNLPDEQLRYYRNHFRNRRDLSIIVFVAAWGLNVVDAYVFSQLRDFDVGPELSLHPTNPPIFMGDQSIGFDLRVTVPLQRKK